MSTPASPAKRPPVAPANAATRPCRNVFIYGYCKNEGKGCPFNHDGSDRPPENTVVVSSPDQLKVLRTPGSVVGLAGAGGATDGGSGSPALMHPAYSPGVFTSEHFQQYRSTSQERGASATGPAPATSTPSSPLVTAAARAAARTAAAALNTAAATSARSREASTSRLIDGVSSLGLRSDGTADALATADVSMAVGYDETGLVAGGDSDAEGLDGYGHHDGGGYFPITVSTTSVAPANAELNHHLYFPLHPAHPPPKTGSRALSHFFVPEALRADLTRRTHAAVRPPSPATAASLPALLNGKYHTLVPLGATHSNGSGNGHDRGGNAVATMTKSADPVLGFPLHWYRATCSVDGSAVALCRVVGFRFASESVLRNVVDKWRKVVHPGIARLLEVFTVSGAWSGAASGESCMLHHFP
ncbi:hypothetical protein BC828DRAFT_395996 [Blastocladiella britannica]|nr:hypothetical protein BC828DRAFT_395996 [Blastocladiella britannica]